MQGQVHPKGVLSRDLVASSIRGAARTDPHPCWSVLAHKVPAKVTFPSRKKPLSSGQRGQCLILPRGFTRPLYKEEAQKTLLLGIRAASGTFQESQKGF